MAVPDSPLKESLKIEAVCVNEKGILVRLQRDAAALLST